MTDRQLLFLSTDDVSVRFNPDTRQVAFTLNTTPGVCKHKSDEFFNGLAAERADAFALMMEHRERVAGLLGWTVVDEDDVRPGWLHGTPEGLQKIALAA